jgi:hypothetical protein
LHCGSIGEFAWEVVMPILTVEGKVGHRQIRLPAGVLLPEHARVFVVVPEVEATLEARLYSPRLKNPQQLVDFTKEVVEAPANAEL